MLDAITTTEQRHLTRRQCGRPLLHSIMKRDVQSAKLAVLTLPRMSCAPLPAGVTYLVIVVIGFPEPATERGSAFPSSRPKMLREFLAPCHDELGKRGHIIQRHVKFT
jgi:hypothetical protein